MDAVLKVFAEAGVQWMGWGLSCVLIALLYRTNNRVLDLIIKNTEALVKMVTIVERLPPGGRS